MWEIGKEQKAQNSALLLVAYEVPVRKPNELGAGLEEIEAWGLGDLRKWVTATSDFSLHAHPREEEADRSCPGVS